MPTASFIPKGEKFLATIRRASLEETIDGVEFDSAAAAVIHARRVLREEDTAWRAARGEPETHAEVKMLRNWKLEKAEEQRKLREQFDMRGVEVVHKKRRLR